MMLPVNGSTIVDPNIQFSPTYTYRIDTFRKRIVGFVDEQNAMVQAIDKIFETERFSWEIYNDQYGIELEPLIGAPMDFVRAVVRERVEDALLGDDRIISVSDFAIVRQTLDTLTVKLTAQTIYGPINYTREMRL